ncbi:MAG: tRNA lysidine(34) synthetase TilS [Tyzzerella sp.]|nr:tRNA lysidine(34) synthetase TilS [Tyzzerella sp.]
MFAKVKNYAEKYQMFSSEDCVIAGVSGGADSVCLLFVLLELREEIGFELVAVHVHHGLRGVEADADEEFVKKLCEERGVLLERYHADVAAIAKERRQSTEEAGREVRREFFEQARVKYHGTKIAMAHHQNDNAETFLFRLARGTGLKGLGGMAPVKEQFVRPLLCVDRREIEEYLKEQNISYCIDATNESDEYARNRIRNHMLPFMETELNSKAICHINETMEHIRGIWEYVGEQTNQYVKQCVYQTGRGYVIEEEQYRKVPEALQAILIRNVLVAVCKKEKDLEGIHLNQIKELFDKQTGRKIDLPYQMEAKRVYDGVEIGKKQQRQEMDSEEIFFELCNNQETYHWKNYNISCRVLNKMQIDGETLEKSHTKWFDCDIIKHGVSIRTRRQGDYITIHPDGRTQKLKTYFINEKIPQEERDEILLIADGSHVLWIVGHRVNCAYQTKENTNCVLEIHVDEGERHGRDN